MSSVLLRTPLFWIETDQSRPSLAFSQRVIPFLPPILPGTVPQRTGCRASGSENTDDPSYSVTGPELIHRSSEFQVSAASFELGWHECVGKGQEQVAGGRRGILALFSGEKNVVKPSEGGSIAKHQYGNVEIQIYK
ncbi:hypothetical protein R3P38DRAFT_2801970 [Favolaschia claudopus]|uniref:Uncharacterized protein n=1 Tax=Favolaschia claudopus TaxID=2862362 RepID=A0AAV9ZVH0_9AGAR